MRTFRCPNCKIEEEETVYIKIEEVYCRPCKMLLVALYKPNKRILKLEWKLAKRITENPNIVVTSKLLIKIQTFI